VYQFGSRGHGSFHMLLPAFSCGPCLPVWFAFPRFSPQLSKLEGKVLVLGFGFILFFAPPQYDAFVTSRGLFSLKSAFFLCHFLKQLLSPETSSFRFFFFRAFSGLNDSFFHSIMVYTDLSMSVFCPPLDLRLGGTKSTILALRMNVPANDFCVDYQV